MEINFHVNKLAGWKVDDDSNQMQFWGWKTQWRRMKQQTDRLIIKLLSKTFMRPSMVSYDITTYHETHLASIFHICVKSFMLFLFFLQLSLGWTLRPTFVFVTSTLIGKKNPRGAEWRHSKLPRGANHKKGLALEKVTFFDGRNQIYKAQ